ncbi:hypothetical protein ACQJ93_05820 [Helicobacter pylori]
MGYFWIVFMDYRLFHMDSMDLPSKPAKQLQEIILNPDLLLCLP